MKKILLLLLFFIQLLYTAHAQTDTVAFVNTKNVMIPMRDGVKLFTRILFPSNYNHKVPILIERTPYGIGSLNDTMFNTNRFRGDFANYMKSGYILVFQDIRGKFKSEGHFEMKSPLYHLQNKARTDESTDTWDTIDWLVKNVDNNNGKVGIHGVSYPGWLALQAAADPHPALKASSPQAAPADMFLGDDFHHNGAFRLSYGFEYSYLVENEKEGNSDFPFPQFDLYDWYLKLGSLKNVNEKYFKNKLPSWNDFTAHPNYDSFWQKQSDLLNIHLPKIPILHVGGYYDQEDQNGPQLMYNHLEKKDSFHHNFIVLGPWNHGGWFSPKGDSLGKINFDSATALYFQELQKKWFDYWLKGIGDGNFAEANCFQTGSNQWKSYSTWPPKNAELKKLYAHADNTVNFVKPGQANGSVMYTSDPSKPVPYRARPIEATYGFDSHWFPWQVEDQRFVSSRPDVVNFVGDSLTENVTVTGNITAHLFASTTGTDADFVVKLIDVYPDKNSSNILMSNYEFPVAMEVFRGRFRKSFEKPTPFTPGKPEEIVIDLHQVNHTFLKGHKLMIQVQSTWFPVIDRNPQKFVPNIFEAKETDYIKANQTIYCNSQYATFIELPIIKE